MKKRMLIICIAIIVVFTTACSKETTLDDKNANESQIEQESEVVEEATVTIYYGNSQADGFETKEITLTQMSPQSIVDALAKVNVVAIGTKVQEFSQDGKSLKLDLSKQFDEYISMMGTSGEYIVIGGIVNTFLSIYEADEIEITVNEKVIETGHCIYDKPQNFYDNNETTVSDDDVSDSVEGIPMSYRLKDEGYTAEGVEVYYPQVIDMPDDAIEEQWNSALATIASTFILDGVRYDIKNATNAEKFDSYKVDYEITTCDMKLLSFKIHKTILPKGEKKNVEYDNAITFDLVKGQNVTLTDWNKTKELVQMMLDEKYEKLMNAKVSGEEFDTYMKHKNPSKEAYETTFAAYDYDISNLKQNISGTSYIKDDKLYIIPVVSKDMGYSAIIDTGIKVR